jgi:signal peptidase I
VASSRLDPYLEWLQDNAEAVVVAYLFALIIRVFFIDVYQIPTGSMEPTLMGNHVVDGRVVGRGDRIMATKFAYGLRDVRRFDVAIFRFPLNQSKVFIKRVAGLPNEEIFFYRGDLFVRPAGTDEPFRIARKPDDIQAAIWIPAYAYDREDFPRAVRSDRADLLDSGIRIREDGEVLFPASRTWSDPWQERFVELTDVGVRFRAGCRSDGLLLVRVENPYGAFEARLQPGAAGTIRDETFGKEMPCPALPAGRDARVFVGFRDGRFHVQVDTQETILDVFDSYRDAFGRSSRYSRTDTRILIRAAQGEWTIQHLRFLRDIHYDATQSLVGEGPDRAVRTGPDEFLMLGDNSRNSHDGRRWKIRTYRLRDGRRILCDPENRNVEADARGVIIHADVHGTPWLLPYEEIEGAPEEEPAPFVHRRHILGRAFWVWLPGQGGAIRLIR